MPSPQTGGPGAVTAAGTTVPAGFDAWLGNGGGDYIAPAFNTQNISFSGIHLADGMWHGTEDNYTTAVVGNVSIAWIRHVVAENPDRPFFAYVAPKAAHEPVGFLPLYSRFSVCSHVHCDGIRAVQPCAMVPNRLGRELAGFRTHNEPSVEQLRGSPRGSSRQHRH